MDTLVLTDGEARVTLQARGAVTLDWRVPVGGRVVPLLATPPQGPDSGFMGAIVGRVANRIGGASYVHNGRRVVLEANDGTHQLHGGARGLWAVDWQMERLDARNALLRHMSPAGEGGFPGTVQFEVAVHLDGARLTYDLRAEADEETPISLAQHNYYALGGDGLRGHRLRLAADRVLERNAEGIMSGRILPVDGTPFDLREGRDLPDGPGAPGLLDDFLLFDEAREPGLPVADLIGPSGLRLRLWSDQPGAQVYTGQHLRGRPCAGVCLEPSGLPNAVNCPAFPSILLRPGQRYRQVLTVAVDQI